MIYYEDLGKLNRPFHEDFRKVFDEVLNKGWFILGNCVKQFEDDFSRYCKSTFCVGVASGLDALLLSLLTLDLPKNSEIIVPSNTYIATILAILNAGHVPVLVEPELTSYNIDPFKIEDKITSKTRAIMVVHLYGKACTMDPIIDICKRRQLSLIEDCAQSHGATYKGKMTGTFGEFGAVSFYPTKNLGALGDAGAVLVQNAEFDRRIRSLRNYGSAVKYYNDDIGLNSRLDELQAAFLTIKLKTLDSVIDHKRRLAKIYSAELKEDFIRPVVQKDHYDVFHIYNVRHPRRDELRQYLERNGIRTEVHYPIPPHHQKAYVGLFQGESYPTSELIHNTTISLPISYSHTTDEIRQVVDVMNKF